MTFDLQAFQAFLYAEIPLVQNMQLQLQNITESELKATAPITPNINDKQTVFGGSSAALMTICGWTLIKTNLEKLGIHNDVVIHKADNHWQKAQTDDLIIMAHVNPEISWTDIEKQLQTRNRSHKLQVNCKVLNQSHEICSQMSGQYVILKK